MTPHHTIDYGNGILAIDAAYLRPQLAAVHLLREKDRAALIDTGAHSAVPRIMASLAAQQLPAEQIDYLILTHIHLDHAGAAGALMRRLPNARLLVHPAGARHMADPSKLIAGAIAVYGEQRFQQLYGEILPIDAQRIIAVGHEEEFSLNGRTLRMLHTPGHARHHICIRDAHTGHIFTGDTFGLSYRELDRDGRQFICPTTSPVHFDPIALDQSLDLLLSLQPSALYLTHYGQIRDVPRLGADLQRMLQAITAAALPFKHAGTQRHAQLTQILENLLLTEA
ncbi:MAG: MBL fold metallo-hydrolase, partial [Sterolibacterium sp.]|nr:MBL fold metallo-hydrolase [Sterolibacterium sp.]